MLKVEKKSDGWYVGGERHATQAEATRKLIALLMAPARAAPKPSRVAAPRVVTPPPPPPKPSRVAAPVPSPLARKEGKWEVLNTRDGGVRAMEHFLPPKEATAAFATLKTEIAWRQDYLKMYGRDIPVPRLQQAYGDRGVTYTYSKITMPALPWTPTLAALRDKVEAVTGVRPNFVLCNYYRTGSDSVSWHADDEKELGPNPFISSVSLGAERDFLLKHRSGEQVTVRLVSGSLLVMDGPLQTFWQHSIPKTKSPVGGRINLTFRVVGATRRK